MIYKMENTIQHYHWGTSDYIPNLLSKENKNNTPYAELWMGAHSKSPSKIFDQELDFPMNQWIDQKKEKVLGEICWKKYKGLPYLLKILSIKDPLSIQVHPNKKDAEVGYKRENDEGIPLESPTRSYKDDNHKPEIICALSNFWALKGFRKFDEILHLMDFLPTFGTTYLRSLSNLKEEDRLRKFYHWIMELEGDEEEEILLSTSKMNQKRKESFWVNELLNVYPGDISALAPLYLNLINLQVGEALFLKPGELHAYLKGNGVELMSNSDNVLRAGLTSKHMDIPELNRIVEFKASEKDIFSDKNGIYPSFIDDFRLKILKDQKKIDNLSQSISVYLNLGDDVYISDENGIELHINKGESFFSDISTEKLLLKGENILFYQAEWRSEFDSVG